MLKTVCFFLASSGCSRNAIKNIITIQTIIFFHHKTICFLFLPKRQRYIMSGVQFVKENHPTSLYENAKKLKIKKSFQDSLYRTWPHPPCWISRQKIVLAYCTAKWFHLKKKFQLTKHVFTFYNLTKILFLEVFAFLSESG